MHEKRKVHVQGRIDKRIQAKVLGVMNMRGKAIPITVALISALLTGCVSANLVAYPPDGKKFPVVFYAGNKSAGVDDLLIIHEANYYGTVGYQMNDPLGDISFRLRDGRKFQAECAEHGQNSIGKPECKKYRVYRTTFKPVPIDTIIPRPDIL